MIFFSNLGKVALFYKCFGFVIGRVVSPELGPVMSVFSGSLAVWPAKEPVTYSER